MKKVERPLLAVVSPHPDDAALSASATLRGAIAAGWDVLVVTVYSVSAFAPFGPDGDVDAVTAARAAEDQRFVRRLGADGGAAVRHVNLARHDAPIRLGLGDNDCPTSRETPDAAKAADVAALSTSFRDVLDAATSILLPLGLGDHVDHVTARDAGHAVARADQHLVYYEDLPYAAEFTATEVNLAIDATAARLGTPLHAFRVPLGDPMTRYTDCRTYATQIDSEGAWALIAYLARHGRAERLWSARAAPPFPFANPVVS